MSPFLRWVSKLMALAHFLICSRLIWLAESIFNVILRPLKDLTLSGNNFIELQPGFLNSLVHIVQIQVKSNPISSIRPLTFHSLDKLESVSIENNDQLSFVDQSGLCWHIHVHMGIYVQISFQCTNVIREKMTPNETIRFKCAIAKKAFSNLTSLETISLKEIGAFWILEFLERHRIIIRIIPDYDVENFHFSKSKLFTLCIFYSIQRNKPWVLNSIWIFCRNWLPENPFSDKIIHLWKEQSKVILYWSTCLRRNWQS